MDEAVVDEIGAEVDGLAGKGGRAWRMPPLLLLAAAGMTLDASSAALLGLR